MFFVLVWMPLIISANGGLVIRGYHGSFPYDQGPAFLLARMGNRCHVISVVGSALTLILAALAGRMFWFLFIDFDPQQFIKTGGTVHRIFKNIRSSLITDNGPVSQLFCRRCWDIRRAGLVCDSEIALNFNN